jgi:hypothetical protein
MRVREFNVKTDTCININCFPRTHWVMLCTSADVKNLIYSAFIYFGFECTWRRLFQKRVVRTYYFFHICVLLKLVWCPVVEIMHGVDDVDSYLLDINKQASKQTNMLLVYKVMIKAFHS